MSRSLNPRREGPIHARKENPPPPGDWAVPVTCVSILASYLGVRALIPFRKHTLNLNINKHLLREQNLIIVH